MAFPSGGGPVVSHNNPAPVNAESAIPAQNARVLGTSRVMNVSRVTVTTSGTPVKPPQFRIPEGTVVEVRPVSSNAKAVYVGDIPKPRVSSAVPGAGALMLNPTDIPVLINTRQNLAYYTVDADQSGDSVDFVIKWV